jgi:U4/U6 small nuclear ribonucleoprotein PRP3
VKEEDNSIDTNNNGNSFENVKSVDLSEVRVKEEVNGQPTGGGSGSTTENGGVSTANVSFLPGFTFIFRACFGYSFPLCLFAVLWFD